MSRDWPGSKEPVKGVRPRAREVASPPLGRARTNQLWKVFKTKEPLNFLSHVNKNIIHSTHNRDSIADGSLVFLSVHQNSIIRSSSSFKLQFKAIARQTTKKRVNHLPIVLCSEDTRILVRLHARCQPVSSVHVTLILQLCSYRHTKYAAAGISWATYGWSEMPPSSVLSPRRPNSGTAVPAAIAL